jgi:hypothetical protein
MTPNSRGYRDGRDVVLPPISRVKLGTEIYTANSIESMNYAGFAVVIGMMFLSCPRNIDVDFDWRSRVIKMMLVAESSPAHWRNTPLNEDNPNTV